MDLGFQSHAIHPHRILDAVLVINDIFLRQNMDHLAIEGKGYGLCRINDAGDIRLFDFFFLDGYDPVTVEAFDMRTGDPRVHGSNITTRHELGFFDGSPDCLYSRVDIDNDAFAQSFRGISPHADYIDAVFCLFSHNSTHFGCPNVQPDNQGSLLRHGAPILPCTRHFTPRLVTCPISAPVQTRNGHWQ